MDRQDHRQFHDLCKQLLAFEPQSRVTAAKAMEHEFFHLNITPEYSEMSLLQYPDAPIPPPHMPPHLSQPAARMPVGVAGVSTWASSEGTLVMAGIAQYPRSDAADAVGPSGPSTFLQGAAPNSSNASNDVPQQVIFRFFPPSCALRVTRAFSRGTVCCFAGVHGLHRVFHSVVLNRVVWDVCVQITRSVHNCTMGKGRVFVCFTL